MNNLVHLKKINYFNKGFLFELGTLTWLSIIPLDVVKSRMQANLQENLNFVKCFKLIYKESGFRGYFKGAVPMLIRGFLVSSVTFCFHFQTLGLINRI